MSNSKKITIQERSAESGSEERPRHVYTIELGSAYADLPSLTLSRDGATIFEIIEPTEPLDPKDIDQNLQEILDRYSNGSGESSPENAAEGNIRAKLHYAPYEMSDRFVDSVTVSILNELIVRLILGRAYASEYILTDGTLVLPIDRSGSDSISQIAQRELDEMIGNLSLSDLRDADRLDELDGFSSGEVREIVVTGLESIDEPLDSEEYIPPSTYRIRYRSTPCPALTVYMDGEEKFAVHDPTDPLDDEDIDDDMQEILDRYSNGSPESSLEGNIRAKLHYAPYDELDFGGVEMHLFDELIVRLILNRPHAREYILTRSSLSVLGGPKVAIPTTGSGLADFDFVGLIDLLGSQVAAEPHSSS